MHAHVLYLSVSIVSLVSTSNERRVRKRVQGEQTTGTFFLDTLPSTWFKMVGIFLEQVDRTLLLLNAKPWSTSQAQSDKDYLRLKFNKGPVSLSLCKLAKLKFLLNALLPLCCECLACVASGHWLSLGRGAVGQRVLKIQRMHAPKHPVRTHCWKEPHRGQQYAWT